MSMSPFLERETTPFSAPSKPGYLSRRVPASLVWGIYELLFQVVEQLRQELARVEQKKPRQWQD